LSLFVQVHGDENDSDPLKRKKDAYYVTIARYNKHGKLIADLMAKRYRMRAIFGREADKPFDILRRVFSTITGSARALISAVGHPEAQNVPEAIQKWEGHIWWLGSWDEDDIDKLVSSAIEAIERICQPALETSK
jgi:hypothetical protein